MTAYERGRKAGQTQLAHSLNPYAARTHEEAEWRRGWIREIAEHLRRFRG